MLCTSPTPNSEQITTSLIVADLLEDSHALVLILHQSPLSSVASPVLLAVKSELIFPSLFTFWQKKRNKPNKWLISWATAETQAFFFFNLTSFQSFALSSWGNTERPRQLTVASPTLERLLVSCRGGQKTQKAAWGQGEGAGHLDQDLYGGPCGVVPPQTDSNAIFVCRVRSSSHLMVLISPSRAELSRQSETWT